jgi:transmembrane sensor
MKQQGNSKKLIRFLLGEARPEDTSEFKSRPGGHTLSEERTDNRSGPEASKWETDQEWLRLFQKIQEESPGNAPPPEKTRPLSRPSRKPRRPVRRTGRWYARAAAVVALISGFTVLISYLLDVQQLIGDEPTAREIVAERGERVSAQLQDGTRVILNADSRLVLSLDFMSGNREVELTGEALFAVAEAADEPFRVMTEDAVVEVLGTEFNLRAYPEEEVELVVVNGAVAFGARTGPDHASDVVDGGWRAAMSEAGAVTLEQISSLDPYVAWTAGRLVYDATPFFRVASELERRFDVSIVVDDEAVLHHRVTGTFEDDSLERILEMTTAILGLQYELDKETLVVTISHL